MSYGSHGNAALASGGVLAFTGFQLGYYLLVMVSMIFVGFTLIRLSRRSLAAVSSGSGGARESVRPRRSIFRNGKH